MLRGVRAHPHLPRSYRESRSIAWAREGWFRRLTGYTTGYTHSTLLARSDLLFRPSSCGAIPAPPTRRQEARNHPLIAGAPLGSRAGYDRSTLPRPVSIAVERDHLTYRPARRRSVAAARPAERDHRAGLHAPRAAEDAPRRPGAPQRERDQRRAEVHGARGEEQVLTEEKSDP